jgi:hypothetical protein
MCVYTRVNVVALNPRYAQRTTTMIEVPVDVGDDGSARKL